MEGKPTLRGRLVSREDLESVLNHYPEASDIHFKIDAPCVARVHGRHYVVTNRALQGTEIRDLMTYAYAGSNSGYDGVVAQPKPRYFSYEARSGERFRVILFREASRQMAIVGAVFRRIAAEPWTIEQANPPQDLRDICRKHSNGLVLVTGPTGSGKSSLLSALLRDLLEDADGHHHLCTVEDPVEFTYHSVLTRMDPCTAVVNQLEVGRSVESFAEGVRAHMRMAPTVILVGEVRDNETAQACIDAANTGHLVFATVHSTGVAKTFTRWYYLFDDAMRKGAIYDLATTLRFVLTQNLVRSLDEKRVAVREWLNFDSLNESENFARTFAEAGDRVYEVVSDYVVRYGMPMGRFASDLYQDGKVSRNEVRRYFSEAVNQEGA